MYRCSHPFPAIFLAFMMITSSLYTHCIIIINQTLLKKPLNEFCRNLLSARSLRKQVGSTERILNAMIERSFCSTTTLYEKNRLSRSSFFMQSHVAKNLCLRTGSAQRTESIKYSYAKESCPTPKVRQCREVHSEHHCLHVGLEPVFVLNLPGR